MTWPEVDAARDGVRLVAIPLGSIEQHGPNTSLDTDLVIAEDLTLRLAERFHPQILVAPTIPYGMSAYHMGFPGTVTLRAQTYLHVIEDNVTSLLHHGFDSFLFTNWHTGNESALILALQTLPARLPVRFMAGISLYDLEDEALAKRVGPLAESAGPSFLLRCDAGEAESLDAVFAALAERWGGLDFVDQRGFGTLRMGTPLHMPVIAEELEALSLEVYSFGGEGTPGTAAGWSLR